MSSKKKRQKALARGLEAIESELGKIQSHQLRTRSTIMRIDRILYRLRHDNDPKFRKSFKKVPF